MIWRVLRFLNPVRRPSELGALGAAAWRSARHAAEAPQPVLDGRQPSRVLRELRHTVVLALVCCAVTGGGALGLYLTSGNELQLVAAVLLTAVFAIGGIVAGRRAGKIARWLERN